MMSRVAPCLNLALLGKAGIKLSRILSTICDALALSGCGLMTLTLLWHVYVIADWAITHNGHSKELLDSGIRFALTLELHVPALLLLTPFWIFFRNQAAPIPAQSRWAIKVTVVPVLVLFGLLTMLEMHLQIAFP